MEAGVQSSPTRSTRSLNRSSTYILCVLLRTGDTVSCCPSYINSFDCDLRRWKKKMWFLKYNETDLYIFSCFFFFSFFIRLVMAFQWIIKRKINEITNALCIVFKRHLILSFFFCNSSLRMRNINLRIFSKRELPLPIFSSLYISLRRRNELERKRENIKRKIWRKKKK